MVKYVVDSSRKKYLITKAYKESPEWQSGKKKRIILGYLFFSLPLILYCFIALIRFVMGDELLNVFTHSAIIPLILMIVLWPISIITLKVERHNAKIIPEDRTNDNVILSDNDMLYSYLNERDGYVYEYRMRYSDISRIQYSSSRYTLYVFGGFNVRYLSGAQLVRQEIFSKDKGQLFKIPMYFLDNDKMVDTIRNKSTISIENIE